MQEDHPTGFGLHDANGQLDVPFFVPTPLLEQLEMEHHEHLRLQAEASKRKRDEQYAAAKAAEQARLGSSPSQPPPPSSRGLSPVQAAHALTVPADLPPQPPGTVAVYDWEAARERFEALKNRPAVTDKDAVARDLRHFAQAMANGPWRSVSRPEGWREHLSALAAEMPNFAQVVHAMQRAMALAQLSGSSPVLPPVLLLGPPGVGKTHFTQRLAEVLQTPIHRQPFDNPQSNASLRGTDRHWSTSAAGALWQLVVLGQSANPVVLLDELDKGAHTGGSHRPVDALLSLLEPVTASKVKDLSVDFEFDASHVVYVATANDASRISESVRSRFLEFFIAEPDIDGRLVLANSIFETTLRRLVPVQRVRASFARPTDLQICRLAWLTPRQIRMAVERALGAAAYEGRHHFEDGDFGSSELRTTVASAPMPRRNGEDDSSIFAVV